VTSSRKQGDPRRGGNRGREGRLPLGETIVAAARAGYRDWWRILGLAIPLSLLTAGVNVVFDHYVDPSNAPLKWGAAICSTGIHLAGTVLLSGFICRLVGAARHRMEPLPLLQLARALPWFQLIAADILVTIATAAGVLLFIVPGLVVLTLFVVVGPVIEIEHRKVISALRRSAQLTRRHFWSTALLATAPLAVALALEVIAPEPHQAGEIAQFLIITGLAEAIVDACIAVMLVELCFRLIDAEARAAASTAPRPEDSIAKATAPNEPTGS
jgi:hypothetical protein